MEYIPEAELLLRGVYEVHSRNITWGVWNGEAFVGLRRKFGDWYIDSEYLGHSARGAIKYLGQLHDEVKLVQHFSHKDVPWVAPPYAVNNDLLMGYLFRVAETNEETPWT